MLLVGIGSPKSRHVGVMAEILFQTGCKSRLDEYLLQKGESGGMEQLQKEFCSNHYLEVQQQILSVQGEIIPMYQDLFMEEGKDPCTRTFQTKVGPKCHLDCSGVNWYTKHLRWDGAGGLNGRGDDI